jgi:hypothetical protein
MMRWLVTAVAGIALVLAGCASGSDAGPGGSGTSGSASASATSSSPVEMGNGAFFVLPYRGSGAQRHAIGADGAVGPAAPVPWEFGQEAEATLLKDALGPWALTATVELPLTDVSRTTQLQVRDVETGEVLHEIDVPGWCSGPDGASYPCLLLEENRMVRTTPIDGEGNGTITVSSTTTGETLAEYGPFPGLAGLNPTSSPDTLVVVTYDQAGTQHRFHTLDTRTGDTSEIGAIPTSQPWLCILGDDSVLTYTTSLQVIGPAQVAKVEVPELGARGPGSQGCSADGTHLYVRTDSTVDPEKDLVIDSVSLVDGTRAPALTLPSQNALIRVTR